MCEMKKSEVAGHQVCLAMWGEYYPIGNVCADGGLWTEALWRVMKSNVPGTGQGLISRGREDGTRRESGPNYEVKVKRHQHSHQGKVGR